MLKFLVFSQKAIPAEYKSGFDREINRENLSRLVIGSGVILVAEIIIYLLLREVIYDSDVIVACIILFNICCFPTLLIASRKFEQLGADTIRWIGRVYFSVMLCLGCALSLFAQNDFASTNAYVITIFALAAFFYMPPLESAIIFFSVYLIFWFALPHYQADLDAVTILRVNALIMNLLAWVFNRLIFSMKIDAFLDKRTIEKKNLILGEMAIRDSMTGLLNYASFYKRLTEEIERAKLSRSPLCIIMLDIDNFKSINDQFGHPTGDRVITDIAAILVGTCRKTDILGRYGGEEFIVILPDTGLEEARGSAERVRKAVEEAQTVNGIQVTVSGGLSQCFGESAERLIKKADDALYRAKAKGRNRMET